MKLLIIGSGGREHALAWKLARDSSRPDVFCAPGNAGTAEFACNIDINAENCAELLRWALENRPDMTVVGPEAPLCAGIVDMFEKEGLRIFGPRKSAAAMEGSKEFAKDVMIRAGVPTACSEVFSDFNKALEYARSRQLPLVVKADGLAAGKGVVICRTIAEIEDALKRIMKNREFKSAGERVLIEEYLEGEEVSVLGLVDGKNVALLPSAQDHKRAFDNDEGPNTGGMGAYSPAPMETDEFRELVRNEVFQKTLDELKKRGVEYKGVLYAGLMMTKSGPKVLEFNCRFGDPETQAVMPRLDGDMLPLLEACVDGRLDPGMVRWKNDPCVCVVMAAGGYPGEYNKGDEIKGLEKAAALDNIVVFHAGTKRDGQVVKTAGGRVLGVSATGSSLADAARQAYNGVSIIDFNNVQYRTDIAAKGVR